METLEYENLKNIYINTEPMFSRPRLMFDQARLTNIPINLNLSKEDLLFYMSQIKDEYDLNKNIVKTNEEYLFNSLIESDLAEMPENIKYADIKRTSLDKRVMPKKREDFKINLSLAFYVYDLYKFFHSNFERKTKSLRNDKKNKINNAKNIKDKYKISDAEKDHIKDNANEKLRMYSKSSLITTIASLVTELQQEQVKYYLTVMKELIHGVNQEKETNPFKKQYTNNEIRDSTPKYKNLIIGNSNIVKTNESDIINALFKVK